ncbi:toll/interleukin-1 receptor domain-containing protein [Lentzea sp. NPDC051213]|uniref:toll/interleukin-1 receptor domain-containing protein n=1 Tax=Lentzea sp. NPDC051213 TaxID=3364126 RepID=UPI00379A6AF1
MPSLGGGVTASTFSAIRSPQSKYAWFQAMSSVCTTSDLCPATSVPDLVRLHFAKHLSHEQEEHMKASLRATGAPALPSFDDALTSRTSHARAVAAANRFDVFLVYNTSDLAEVLEISGALRLRGIRPWIDVEQVRPGTWVQDAIQAAVRASRAAAVFLGPRGAGRWQRLEILAFVERCTVEEIPVVPVLLPGVPEVPSELVLLRQLNHVRFRKSVHEPDSLDRLCWGITGDREVPARTAPVHWSRG